MVFKAGTQYGDWEGTAAADGPNSDSIERYLEANGLINPGEYLIATSISIIEGSQYVNAHVVTGGPGMESVRDLIAKTMGPLPVREIPMILSRVRC